ncbi:MAG TPA: ATP-dependent protease LonB, partial [Candidatus Nanoarchaeia archaeon]|nr:ATP-dependent protease LonB [Candidatus Nanoarchaeia archaeon]
QVIGQDAACEIVKKAAKQRRHVLLIGEPGTGKSMLGLALAELLPKEKLVDTLAFANPNDENQPLIRTMPASKGRELVAKARVQNMGFFRLQNIILLALLIASLITPWWARTYYGKDNPVTGAIMFAAFFLGGMLFLAAYVLFMSMGRRALAPKGEIPKVIVDNYGRKQAPFWDATGAHAGALLGDVLHDPLQCLPGDQHVFLPNGKPIQIKELVDPCLHEDGERGARFEILTGSDDHKCMTTTTVTKVFRRTINENIVAIKTRKGYTLKMSKNHPVSVFTDQGKIEYVPAGALHRGQYTVVPYKLPITVSEHIKIPLLLFLADSLADGYFGKRNVAFKIRTAFKKEHFVKDISALGFKPNVTTRGANIEITLNSADFLRSLRKLGVQKTKGKQLPLALFNIDANNIKLFLTRYLSLDGYVNHQGQFEVISKELIPELTALLLKIGVKAKLVPRIDTGFGKEKKTVQPRIRFNDFEFAQFYAQHTINPIHKRNLAIYLKTTTQTRVRYDDNVPLSFDVLEQIRARTGLSRNVIHKSYYALAKHTSKATMLTRQFLQGIVHTFNQHTNCTTLAELKDTAQGNYAFDEITEVKTEPYSGPVYNLTTTNGTYLANFILTHNSGGLGTPAHERVVAGLIHKAHLGVLFVDEIATLDPMTQQELLTSLQEGKYAITGQSERSAGAMVRTEPVPCNFIMVAAGNLETIQHMHPALRSRIRGYGYEVYMKDSIPDTSENQERIARFVAQEVVRDKKIPHFTKDAVLAIIDEARKFANRKGHLTLRLRELGGVIRAAGDIAIEHNAKLVTREHFLIAKKIARPLEQQIADTFIERKREYEIIITEGKQVGRVNGLAVIGGGGTFSGIILPIEAAVGPWGREKEIVATGKLGTIAKEAVKNVTPIVKRYFKTDIKDVDIYVQFLQTYEGVEGDSASIAVATAIISALQEVPIRQDTAMTGSLSVRGEVLPIGG